MPNVATDSSTTRRTRRATHDHINAYRVSVLQPNVATDSSTTSECSHRRLNNNANNNRNRRTADALHHPPGHTRRERRQSVVVEGVGRGHRVPCTEPEKRQAACLRGQCFALNMGHLRHPFCQSVQPCCCLLCCCCCVVGGG
ncbi:hypothetical protein ACOMHN_051813 [Nucella lapillus]